MRPEPTVAMSRVRKARSELLSDEPFFGLLAIRLKLVEDPSCDTMWTDGVSLGFNPGWMSGIPNVELKGVVCHEVMHVVAGHPWRGAGKDHERWNEACDYAINPVVRAYRYLLPLGHLFNEKFVGLSAEAIYRMLAGLDGNPQPKPSKNSKPSSGDDKTEEPGGSPAEQHGDKQPGAESKDNATGSGKGSGKGKSSHAGEVRPAPADSKKPDSGHSPEAWAEAIKAATMAQGELPASLRRVIAQAATAKVNWEEILQDFIQRSFASPDYTWRRPSTRYLATGMYMPRLEGVQMPPMVFVVDTSSSMPDGDISQAQMQMQRVLDEMAPEALYVVYCDAKVAAAERFEPGDVVTLKPRGGGGTDFRPAFRWVEENASDAVAIVYFTDLCGTFPSAKDVAVDTLWAVASNTPAQRWVDSPVPFGSVVHLPAH